MLCVCKNLLLIVLVLVIDTAAARSAFHIYEPCNPGDSSKGFCRKDPASQQLDRGGAQPAAVPTQLPVDMRFPCTDEQHCKLNIDVVQPPERASGTGISSCSIPLMPWSPFPCKYDTSQYYGVPGQVTDFCYAANNHAHAECGSAELASNLTTDGYNNLFEGVMPQQLCGMQQPQVVQLLLTIDFRLATGRQFDRAYTFQIGQVVAAFGTCSEPSRLINADKKWSVVVDITHLQSYLQAGMPTRFAIGNVLSNTYNVPLWAEVKLDVYYNADQLLTSANAGAFGVARSGEHEDTEQVKRRMLLRTATEGALTTWASAHVPDQVVPLVPPGAPWMDVLALLSGSGDRPLQWPNVTYTLPPTFSWAGNIYRAQLLVQPKADACEEFWAMNPSGLFTNNTCGGLSTGEPYREIRAYVSGQVVGFYPVMYTMYTGGIDPRLWTAIVAVNTYSLPTYTFDLSPWLGDLNDVNTPSNITVELVGASGSRWLIAATLLVWRSAGQVTIAPQPLVSMSNSLLWPVRSRCKGADVTSCGTCILRLEPRSMSASTTMMVDGVKFDTFVAYKLHDYYNNITYNNSNGTVFWRQMTKHSAFWFATRHDKHLWQRVTHGVEESADALLSYIQQDTGAATITRSYTLYEWLNHGGVANGAVFEFSDNATIMVAPILADVDAAMRKLTPDDVKLASGSHMDLWSTCIGSRKHYQRLHMLDVYDTSKPLCIVPKRATHTVVLHSMTQQCESEALPLTWHASCAFCSPEPLTNDINIHS